jgi:hypothetical protein
MTIDFFFLAEEFLLLGDTDYSWFVVFMNIVLFPKGFARDWLTLFNMVNFDKLALFRVMLKSLESDFYCYFLTKDFNCTSFLLDFCICTTLDF